MPKKLYGSFRQPKTAARELHVHFRVWLLYPTIDYQVSIQAKYRIPSCACIETQRFFSLVLAGAV